MSQSQRRRAGGSDPLPSPSIRSACVLTQYDLDKLVEEYSDFDEFAFDTETRGTRPSRDLPPEPGKQKSRVKDIPGLDPRTNEVVWISLAGPGRADVIPMGHTLPGPPQLKCSKVFPALEPLFFSTRRKINQNVKFDLLSIAKYYGDEVPPPPYGETMSLIQLLNENLDKRGGYNLENLALYYLGYRYKEKLGEKWVKTPFHRVARYALLDAKMAWMLWWLKRPLYDKPGREKLLYLFNLEMDVLEVLLGMQQYGALVDKAEFENLIPELEERRAEIQVRFDEAAGRPININSTPQKRALLFNQPTDDPPGLGLSTKDPILTETGELSTSAKAIKPLLHHPVVAILKEYQDVQKLLSTYVRGYLPHIDSDDRIRASFNQSIPKTGRFSCSAPNLQNIPIRSKETYDALLIRSWFKAAPGNILIVGDYSQIELRVLATLTHDPTLLRAYREALDLHTLTASKLFKVPEDKVTKDQRATGKTSNFNLAFEGGFGRLMDDTTLTEAEAKKVYDGWHALYPFVKKWGSKMKELAWDQGYVETMYGRRRRLPEIHANNPAVRKYAERQAVNHPIQGSAADIAKHAMVEINDAYRGTPAQLIIQVHDEFIAEAPEEFADDGLALMREAMESIKLNGRPVLSVPLVADVHIGKNWADAK